MIKSTRMSWLLLWRTGFDGINRHERKFKTFAEARKFAVSKKLPPRAFELRGLIEKRVQRWWRSARSFLRHERRPVPRKIWKWVPSGTRRLYGDPTKWTYNKAGLDVTKKASKRKTPLQILHEKILALEKAVRALRPLLRRIEGKKGVKRRARTTSVCKPARLCPPKPKSGRWYKRDGVWRKISTDRVRPYKPWSKARRAAFEKSKNRESKNREHTIDVRNPRWPNRDGYDKVKTRSSKKLKRVIKRVPKKKKRTKAVSRDAQGRTVMDHVRAMARR